MDVQDELWRELLTYLPEGCNVARYKQTEELACRLLRDVR